MAKSDKLNQWTRTHNLSELKASDINSEVCLMGWAQTRRDHGGLIFIDLRDRFGITQIVLDPSHNQTAHQLGEKVRSEFVLAAKGKVRTRPDGMINPKMDTGEIEVLVEELNILNESETPPFPIQDQIEVSEGIRLKYRYLDLRRPTVKNNILKRIKFVSEMRKALEDEGFLDIETPLLYKSTPEGAREFLVPSRIHPGKFYALPQSPQLFKQVLMISGMDRYFQVVKCFRDEDLRADRQPEFTQIDCEVSFENQEGVMQVFQKVIAKAVSNVNGQKIPSDFPRMTYQEAMGRFGCDKPDTRFGLELIDLSEVVAKTEFKVFSSAISTGGIVNAIHVPNGAKFTRKELDEMTDHVRQFGAKGLAWAKVKEGSGSSSWQSPIAKFIPDNIVDQVNQLAQVEAGSLLLFGAGDYSTTKAYLAELRLYLAEKLKLADEKTLNFLWVTDFPLFEEVAKNRYAACHHPFTSPIPEDLDKLESSPAEVKAAAYDLVLNGNEVAGGSVRIHDPATQAQVFNALGLTKEEVEEKFGFLLQALKYGAPPHAGIAFGLDRLAMILACEKSIKDVIPFPKTNKAACLMTESPNSVTAEELRDLHIRTIKQPSPGESP